MRLFRVRLGCNEDLAHRGQVHRPAEGGLRARAGGAQGVHGGLRRGQYPEGRAQDVRPPAEQGAEQNGDRAEVHPADHPAGPLQALLPTLHRPLAWDGHPRRAHHLRDQALRRGHGADDRARAVPAQERARDPVAVPRDWDQAGGRRRGEWGREGAGGAERGHPRGGGRGGGAGWEPAGRRRGRGEAGNPVRVPQLSQSGRAW
mmetsp:Transcript_2233/g.6898  ORF Transcript_2233/g.6898 Transcript_2233/m.6898 type:complete len:203 (-) Transcript_2233:65-673(-)